MIRTDKKHHTDPFLINNENLQVLSEFILNYADECKIEVINYTSKAKEVREFARIEEFFAMKDLISGRISKFIFKGFKGKKQTISLEFKNPTVKIFPYIEPFTLKSSFSIENEDIFLAFSKEYDEIITKIIDYRRISYKILFSFVPAFFAAMFAAMSFLTALARNDGSAGFAFPLLVFLLFSTIFNVLFYPILYIYKPLISFDLNIDMGNIYGAYFNAVKGFLRKNFRYFAIVIVTILIVIFFEKVTDFLV